MKIFILSEVKIWFTIHYKKIMSREDFGKDAGIEPGKQK